MTNNQWYVLQVKTGYELEIAKQLQARGYSAVAPVENRLIRRKGEWIQQMYVVFTGYVFIYMDYSWSKYYVVSGLHGVIKILGGGTAPTALTKNEAVFILKLSELLGEPSVIRFKNDGSYEAVSGFLYDYQDNIVKIERRYKKAIVKLTVAGIDKEVRISFEESQQTPEQTED